VRVPNSGRKELARAKLKRCEAALVLGHESHERAGGRVAHVSGRRALEALERGGDSAGFERNEPGAPRVEREMRQGKERKRCAGRWERRLVGAVKRIF
jgi:hypothetical protein